MRALIAKIGGRKLAALVVEIIAVFAVAFGWDISDELRQKVLEALVWGFGIYIGGQSVADGLSGGKTSSSNNG